MLSRSLSSRAQRGICSLLLVVPVAVLAQTPTQSAAVKPGWRWTYDSALTVVNAVRAGRSLKPSIWPNGSRVAVLLSFDADNETISLRYGEPNVGHLSQMQYGARVALDRVLKLLDKHQIPATFFIPAVSLRISPEMATKIKASGRHEFGIHGW